MSTREENELMGIPNSIQIFEPCGCVECNNTGYRGRTAIHEIIHCTAKVSSIIAAGGGKEEIEKAAKEQGTKLLRDNASELVQAGETSIDELVRATYTV
jgi:type IV pilus assembly protein PilB